MKRILVVDPEPVVRSAAVRYLQREGLRADAAADADEALARLRSQRYDAIVWGEAASGVPIAALHTQIRADSALAAIALVVLRDPDATPLELSGVAMLARPVRLDVLRDTILELIRRGLA